MSILKKSTLVAMSALLVGTTVTPVSAYDNVSLTPVVQNAGATQAMPIEPYAYPEEPTGRVIENTFRVTNKGQKITLQSLAAVLSIYLASVGQLKLASGAAIAGVFIGSIDDTEAFMGEVVTEYYVYDFEGSVIAYKYYVVVTLYEDDNYDSVIDTYELERESVSPLSNNDLNLLEF